MRNRVATVGVDFKVDGIRNSGSRICYASSVLRCNVEDDGCAVCEFLNGSDDVDGMLEVIRILDSKLAEAEKHERTLTTALVNAADRKCAKCQGTGREYRHWNQDYIDCMACDGRGH